MNPRLPIPGSDDGDWGDILNGYLEVSLASDGSLNPGVVGASQIVNGAVSSAQLASNAVTNAQLDTSTQTSLIKANSAFQPTTTLGGDLSGTLPSPTLAKIQGTTVNGSNPGNGQVLTYSSSASAWVPGTVSSSTVNNATTASTGIIELSNDLGGTATSPEVVTVLNGQTPITHATAVSGDLSGTLPSPTIAKIQGTIISSPTGGSTSYLNANGTWTTPAAGSSSSNATSSAPGLVQLDGDLGGSATSPEVTSVSLTNPLSIAQGGTGTTSQNFVDLSSSQNIGGAKNFTGGLTVNGLSVNSSPTYQNYKTASYTLQLSDANTIVPFIAGTLCTLTIPTNANVAFPLGTVIYIQNTYCTQVNLAVQSGVSLTGERISLPGGAVVMLLKEETNTWIVSSVNNNQRNATNHYYPEDYGFVGGSDDTPALQGAIDAAAANGGGVIVMRAQSYTLTSSPRTDRGGHSVLALPNTNSGVISFSGVKGLTVINCSLSGQSYSSSYGVPSVIGGPTPEQNSNNSSYKIDWYVNMDGITVSVTNNPTYSGIDLYCVTRTNLSDVHVTMGGYGSQPTSAYSFGIRTPGSDNYGVVNLTNVLVDGFYFGYVVYQSHAILYQTISNLCYVAYGLIAGGDTHATTGTGVQWQECKYGITGYSTSGVASLATVFYISFPLLDLEDGVTGQWYSSPIHVVDANNMIHGQINYSRTTANIGGDVGALTVSGAANLTMHDLNANSIYATPSMSSNWSAVTSVGSTTTLIPLRYKKDRTGLVRLEGTFSKSTSMTSGEVAFTLPASFRPSGGLYFTTVTDTGSGVIKYDGQNPGNFVWISGGTNTSGVGFITLSAIYEGLA